MYMITLLALTILDDLRTGILGVVKHRKASLSARQWSISFLEREKDLREEKERRRRSRSSRLRNFINKKY